MKYINYLKSQLPSDWKITEELDINWDGVTTLAVYKEQTGTSFQDSQVIPFQLVVSTNDVLNAKAILEDFSHANQNTFYVEGLNTYAKQYFYTPFIPTIAGSIANQLTNYIILSGSLIISTDISDVRSVTIDGEEVKATMVSISFSTQAEAHVNPFANSSSLATVVNKGSTIQIQIAGINKNTSFFSKLRMMRLGQLPINTIFKLDLAFTDNETIETYYAKISSSVINSETSNLPLNTVVFSRVESVE